MNPDLFVSVEARPDTIIHLINGHELYVAEQPAEIADLVRAYRAEVMRAAFNGDFPVEARGVRSDG